MSARCPRTPKRVRIQPPPGKAELFWSSKINTPVVGSTLASLDAKLAAIDAEHASKWPDALDTNV